MATAVKSHSPSTSHAKPSVPPKPLRPSPFTERGKEDLPSAGAKRSRITAPTVSPPPPPIVSSNPDEPHAHLTQALVLAEEAKARSQGNSPTGSLTTEKEQENRKTDSKQGPSGVQVKRSHSSAAETGIRNGNEAKVRRHHSVREGKENIPEIKPDAGKEGKSSKSKFGLKQSDQDESDIQSRMRDCLWSPLTSFVVKTKAGGAALVEKGSRKLFGKGGLPLRGRKSKKRPPTPPFEEEVITVRSRPKVPPRPLLHRLLQGIATKEQGVWHKLDHVKYIDEEVSTEDSTDYTDVDWGKALNTDPGEEDIIYYTYVEEAPNEKVVFFQRLKSSQVYSSSEDEACSLELNNESLIPRVAEMENMEIDTELKSSVLPSVLETVPSERTTSKEDLFPSTNVPYSEVDSDMGHSKMFEESVMEIDKGESPVHTSPIMTETSNIDMNGDENANILYVAEVHPSQNHVYENAEFIPVVEVSQSITLTPETRKRSPQYASVQKSGVPEKPGRLIESPTDEKLSESYYDLDVQEIKPKMKPKRPPLPKKPSRPAPPVPPKTYMCLKFPPNKPQEKLTEESGISEEKNVESEGKKEVNIVITEPEIENRIVNGEVGVDAEGVSAMQEEVIDIPGEKVKMVECDLVDDDKTIRSIASENEVLSIVTESFAETGPDDLSERRSHWADSEASLEKHIPYWESRSVSVPPSITSESGFVSSPTPPPRQKKFRHHSVEGVMRRDYNKNRDSPSRRSKSCSDADVSRGQDDSPVLKNSRTSTLTRDASTNTKPQRPPRPALKPKPDRPPKPLPPAIKKLALPMAVKEEGEFGTADAVSLISSGEESPHLGRMRARPLPPPPAPPRQRSPRPVKKPIEPSPTPEPQPLTKPLTSSFPLEFLHKLSEIEAGKLNLSEINVKKINVDEIDASLIKVSTLQVGQMTPLALLTQTKMSTDSRPETPADEISPKETERTVSSKHSEEMDKKEKEEDDEEKKESEDEKKDKKKKGDDDDDNNKKDGDGQGKKDDDDKKDDGGNEGGNGGEGNDKRDDHNDKGDDKMDEGDDSEPPDWWKDSVPPSNDPNLDPNSITTGSNPQQKNDQSVARQCHSKPNEKLKVIDRLIITPVLPSESGGNSTFYTNEDKKPCPLSRSPSQKSSSSTSSREEKPLGKSRHRKSSKSSWYDEGAIPGQSGDIDTSDGWMDGNIHHKRMSLPEEREVHTIIDSDVEGASQVRRQIASLFNSFNSRERKKSSHFYTKEDSQGSSSTTDTEQEDSKNVRSSSTHRVRSLSSGCSPRSPKESALLPEWPKVDQNANYTPNDEDEGKNTIEGEIEQCFKNFEKQNPRQLKTSHSFPSHFSKTIKNSNDSSGFSSPSVERRHKSSEIPSDNRRHTAMSNLSLPNSEDSWYNCTSGDESDTESSFLTSQSCFEAEAHSDVAEHRRAKKFLIARELMTSEQVFVDVLKLLNEDFRGVIGQANNQNGHKVIPDGALNHILRYLPQLQNLNEDLLKDLTERIEKWDEIGRIADVIVKKGPFLKLYSAYIKDFESITAALDDACRKYPDFAQVVKDFEMSERCQKLALKHYMLKPVQRIPQYKLLLEDYLKHLQKDSPDYDDTIAALTIVSDVANHANQTMKQGDNFAKLLQIQNSLIGNYEIIKPGRTFLKEGELFKLSRKVMQPRWFILFNDSLLHTDMVQQGVYRLHHELALTGMRVMLPTNEEYQNEFSIISISRSFTLSANSPSERDSWISSLNKAIEANTARRGTFVNAIDKQSKVPLLDVMTVPISLGRQAPVWIPDSRVTMCQLCTCEFTVTFRRHHCRACGKVVCSNCSANRAPLQYLKYQAVRVCDECFDKLAEEFEAGENTLNESDCSTECTVSDGKNSGSDESGSAVRANIKAQFKRFAVPNGRKVKRYLPKVLKEISANHQGATYSGYLQKRVKKSWRRMWFVINDKVLYTYKASEDVAALESIPLLGFKVAPCSEVFESIDPKLVFQLSHPGHSPIIFHAENIQAVEKWIKAMESATVL